MKFKVGDKVKICSTLQCGEKYVGYFFGEGMRQYVGREATIKKVNKMDISYHLDIDNEDWLWTDEMLVVAEAIEL